MKTVGLAFLLCSTALIGACNNGDSSVNPGDGGTDGDAAGNGVLYETCPSTCPTAISCPHGQIKTCCTCITPPTANAGRTRCGQMSEYCDPNNPADPVDISCLMESGWPSPPPTDPPLVTVRGIVDVFGNGNSGAGGDITVEFYNMGEGGTLGTLIASTRATLDACQDDLVPPEFESGDEATCCPGPCQELMPDVTGCTPTSGDCRRLWLYEVHDIPTSTPLILHTSGNTSFWKDLYYSNVFFFPGDVTADGYVYYVAKTLSIDDWNGIPASAGDFDGITPGHGGVAGEIHDCGNIKLANATVGLNPLPNTQVYFNGNEAKAYPDTLRLSTNIDALYAGLDIVPGPVRVSALAQVAGVGLVNLGWWDAHVFPDALTVVTIRGTRPTQVPAASP